MLRAFPDPRHWYPAMKQTHINPGKNIKMALPFLDAPNDP